MTLLETSPADWIRNLLSEQPDIRDAAFDVPPHQNRILVLSRHGQRFAITLRRPGNYEQRY